MLKLSIGTHIVQRPFKKSHLLFNKKVLFHCTPGDFQLLSLPEAIERAPWLSRPPNETENKTLWNQSPPGWKKNISSKFITNLSLWLAAAGPNFVTFSSLFVLAPYRVFLKIWERVCLRKVWDPERWDQLFVRPRICEATHNYGRRCEAILNFFVNPTDVLDALLQLLHLHWHATPMSRHAYWGLPWLRPQTQWCNRYDSNFSAPTQKLVLAAFSMHIQKMRLSNLLCLQPMQKRLKRKRRKRRRIQWLVISGKIENNAHHWSRSTKSLFFTC